MGSRTLQAETTAEAYLELLKDRGIDVFLGNAGTDFASLVEAFARFESAGGRAPRPMVVPHEFVAVSMAHGYYVAGGRPAAVMVHVNVGTGNASTAIITAARANVPIFMSAGRTPITEEGLPGARDLHIHWAQESFDQAAMLREYVKWDYELRTPVQVESVVDRAFELMLAEPRGPVYLTLPREVLAARPGPMTITSPSRRVSRSERFPDPARIDEAARILARAEHPIILTSAAGIDARAVAGLVEVAEAGGIGVVEADPIYMNVSHRHDLHLGYNQSGTTNPSLGEADAVLVVEADVPWYPHLKKPAPGAPIIHLGVDPFFSRYPMRSYPCDVPIVATPGAALPLLAEAVRRHADRQAVGRRRERIVAEHRKRQAAWDETALRQASAPTIGFAWASRCIGGPAHGRTGGGNRVPLGGPVTAAVRGAKGPERRRPGSSGAWPPAARAGPRSSTCSASGLFRRGAPRWPPSFSSEGGYAPLGLPRPTLGARRRSRGTPRHCSGGLEPGQPPEESLAVQARHRLLVDERVGRREARNDPEAMEHVRAGAHAPRRRIHRAPHELGEVEVGGLEDLTVRLAAVLPDHLDAERPVGAESVDALGVRADVAQDDVGVSLRVATGRRGAAVLERHVEPPEILDEIPATPRRLERLGRVHDDDVDRRGIEEPFELGPAPSHRDDRGVLVEVPAPALERHRDRAVV